MKNFLILLLLSILCITNAEAQWYFGSGEAVNLSPSIKQSTGVKIMSGALDPSSTAVNAPAASIYQSTSGTVYVKQDGGLSTNWLPIGVAAPSSLSTINGQSGPAVILAAGTAGTDFAISASANTITFDIPSASGTNRGLLTSANWTTFNNKEPAITATTSADYYRGDKTFQPLNKAAVGLANVDNTSDANKPVSTAQQTALDLKADLASPTFTGTVSGITKSMVGLGNVTNDAQLKAADLDTDGTLAANSDSKIASQKATKTYADTKIAATYLDTDGTLAANSDSKIATQKATKTYADTKEPAITVLPLSKGGTNNGSLTAAAGSVLYTDATKVQKNTAGTSDQVLYGGTAPSFGEPKIGIGNESVGGTLQTQILLPNKQATVLDGALSTRIETGNGNLLENPSYEADVVDTGWTCTTVTPTEETTIKFDGTKSLKLSPSSQAFECYQDSPLNATYVAGSNMQAIARIYSSVAGVYVCPRINQTTDTGNCASVDSLNSFAVPWGTNFIAGTTHSGISITTKGVAVTGNVYADAATVEPTKLFTVDSSKIAGESYFAATTNCGDGWTRTSTSLGVLGTDADCPGPTIAYSSMGSWQTTDANLPRQTVNSLPPGVYKATFTFNSNMSTASVSMAAINDGTTTCNGVRINADTASSSNTVSCTFIYTESGNRTFDLYVASAANAVQVANNTTSPTANAVKFSLEYFGNNQVYNSQCGANCVDTYSATANGATGVIASENVDFINGSGVVTDTSLTTYTFNSGIFTVTPVCIVAGVSSTFVRTASVESVSTTAVAVRGYDVATPSKAAINQQIICQKQGADFTAARLIQGTFKNMSQYPGINKPKTVRAAYGGVGATLTNPVACTTGTCTEIYDEAGVFTAPSWSNTGLMINATVANGTFANSSPVMCKCTSHHSATAGARDCVTYWETGDQNLGSNSSGGFVTNISTSNNGGTSSDTMFQIECTGESP